MELNKNNLKKINGKNRKFKKKKNLTFLIIKSMISISSLITPFKPKNALNATIFSLSKAQGNKSEEKIFSDGIQKKLFRIFGTWVEFFSFLSLAIKWIISMKYKDKSFISVEPPILLSFVVLIKYFDIETFLLV